MSASPTPELELDLLIDQLLATDDPGALIASGAAARHPELAPVAALLCADARAVAAPSDVARARSRVLTRIGDDAAQSAARGGASRRWSLRLVLAVVVLATMTTAALAQTDTGIGHALRSVPDRVMAPFRGSDHPTRDASPVDDGSGDGAATTPAAPVPPPATTATTTQHPHRRHHRRHRGGSGDGSSSGSDDGGSHDGSGSGSGGGTSGDGGSSDSGGSHGSDGGSGSGGSGSSGGGSDPSGGGSDGGGSGDGGSGGGDDTPEPDAPDAPDTPDT